MKMSSMLTSAKPSSFSVRDILDLPTAKSFSLIPTSGSSLPPLESLPDCPISYGTSVTYGGIFSDHFTRFLPNSSDEYNGKYFYILLISSKKDISPLFVNSSKGPWCKNQVNPDSQILGESQMKLVSIGH